MGVTNRAINGFTDIKVNFNPVGMDKQRPATLARNTDIKWRRTIPKLGKRVHIGASKCGIVGGRCLVECLGMQEERKEREARKTRGVG